MIETNEEPRNIVKTVDEITRIIRVTQPGPPGADGSEGSLPPGGTDGQVLTKQSATNGDADWEDPTGGGDMAAEINGATAKTTPVDADLLGITDSAASFSLKKLTWANLKATLKSYYDTLYANITHTHDIDDVTNLQSNLDGKVDVTDAYNEGDLYVRFGGGASGLSKADLAADGAFADTYDPLGAADAAVGALTQDDIEDGATYKQYSSSEKSKLAGIESGAEVNNISDANATDLTDGGDTTLHKHDDRYYTESETDTLLSAKQNSLGFTAENVANKDIDGTLAANSDTKYASQKATKTYADTKVAASVISASGKGIVVHGSTAGTSRPTGYASIEWIGDVEPTNATNDDTWIDTSS